MAAPTIANLVKRINTELATSGEHEVDWHGPATDADLQAIEARLGCRLPASFREFLLMTGGGGLQPLYVSTAAINEEGSSIIGDTLYWREHFKLPSHLVVIERDWDDNEPMCLDTSAFRGEECPVVLFYPNKEDDSIERLAPDFPTWYARYLEPY